jgi:hypothetical protein
MDRLAERGWEYSIGVRNQKPVTAAIATIPETAWVRLADYPPSGEAEIAETTLATRRLIVRRTRLVGDQAELWPDWRHFAFVTNHSDELELVEAEHRQHAVVELVIRDLKDQALAHFPSGHFPANAAWTVISARAQPAALDRLAGRAARPDPPGPHPAPPAARGARPTGPQRPPLATASARPLALGDPAHHRAGTHRRDSPHPLSTSPRSPHHDAATTRPPRSRPRLPAISPHRQAVAPNRPPYAPLTDQQLNFAPRTPPNDNREPLPPSPRQQQPRDGGFRLRRNRYWD